MSVEGYLGGRPHHFKCGEQDRRRFGVATPNRSRDPESESSAHFNELLLWAWAEQPRGDKLAA